MKKLILNNWLAKCVSLALAIVLWAVIKKSIETSSTPNRTPFDAESRFQIDASRYAKPKK